MARFVADHDADAALIARTLFGAVEARLLDRLAKELNLVPHDTKM